MKKFLLVFVVICSLLLSGCIVEPNSAMDKLDTAIYDILSNNYLITYDFMGNYPDDEFCYCYVDGTDYLTYTNISASGSGYTNVFYYFKDNDRYYLYINYTAKEFFFDCTNLAKDDEKYIPAFKYFFTSGIDVDAAIFNAKTGEDTGKWKYNLEEDTFSFVDYIYDISFGEENITKFVMIPEVKNDRTYRVTLKCYFYQYEMAVPVGMVYSDFGTTSIPDKYKPQLNLEDAVEADFQGLMDYFENAEEEEVEEE